MEKRNLGTSGLKVSLAGLGCNNFGRACDAAATRAIVDRAIDLGIDFFDTADIYGEGLSEEFLGRALGNRRQQVVLATKFGMTRDPEKSPAGGSRRYICQAVEESLSRLGTDYIDLYQIHAPDVSTPIAETLGALDDLVRQGKVRYIGCSNFASWQLVEAEWTSRSRRLESFVSAQNLYNLLDRRIERELVPACNAYEVSILPYFPLASGFLTGKYKRGSEPPEGARLSSGPMAQRVLNDANFKQLESLERFASDRGRSILDLAIGWLASQPYVASVIAGATRPDQLEQNVKSLEWRLDADELSEVHALSAR